MNASAGQWLIGSGSAPAAFKVSQGSKLGRAGQITITADPDGRAWVGGGTTTCFRGTATV